MVALPKHVEEIHPALWRGSQLGRACGRTVQTGYAELSAELPGGGWPISTLIELLVQQPGIGEIRLLQPALAATATRPVVMLQAPHIPNSLGLAYLGLPPGKLMWLRAQKTADILWSAERILTAGTCGALLVWQQHIRQESLRRLHLAAQSAETLLVVVRPLACAQDSSPATLRLTVRPAERGVSVEIVKRRGPTRLEKLHVPVQPSPALLSPHGRVRRHSPLVDISAGVPLEAVSSSGGA